MGQVRKTSQDTAARDIADLVNKGMLQRDATGERSTSYSLSSEATGNAQS
jgi:Fic family protein